MASQVEGATSERREEERNRNSENESRHIEEEDTREWYWQQHFGDKRPIQGTGDTTDVRIATININTYPEHGSAKFLTMKEQLQYIDCLGLSELNKNWCKVPSQHSIYNRTSTWWPHQKTQMTWLHEPEWPSEFQQGGVNLTLASNKIAKYGIEKGEDTSGLGRWVWQIIEGHDTKTVIIQVYRPNRNTKDNGSTYIQQQAASGEQDPLDVFDQDFKQMIEMFIDSNHNIIVMGDFNENLNGRSNIEMWMGEHGIFDVLQERYPGQAPATHKRGSSPIDGIFASENLLITQGGYEGGRDELSDHRLLWADFTLDSILGIDRGDIVKPKAKKLQATNRTRVRRFNRALLQQIQQHKLVEKARKLEEDIGTNKSMTEPQKERYEAIDSQRCRAVIHAEKGCAKLPPNDAEFSLVLKRALGIYIIWDLIHRKMKRKCKINTRWIIDTKKRLQVEEHFQIPTTLAEATQQRAEAKGRLREAQRKAPELRLEFLDMLIKQADDQGNVRKARDLRQIRERENTKSVHKRIKLARGKLRGGGVRFVHKHQRDGTVKTIKDKYQMEREIMEANQSKLHLADESPVRQGPLREQITDHDYDRWEEIVQGLFQIETDTDDATKKWLDYYQGLRPQDMDISLTTDEYIKSWRHIKEHTSCTPGAMHFGTFKTMHLCRPIAELHTIMARIPMKTGYVPKRWTQSTDSMLPKKEGEWRPNKLRLTSLLAPDFNHNNKILGRAAMRNAEKHNKLAPEQYGSRKYHSASQHALNKRLMLDALRIQKRPGVIIANDAKACYDRILHVAAFMALRRAGVPKEATISMLEPIRRLNHHIRTAYGDSTFTYGGNEWDRDPSGICQGNGAGPAIWALVSSPLLDILRQAGHGAKLHAAIGNTFLHLSGFAFVDDADTIHTGKAGDTPEMLLNAAQEELNLWEGLIRATGGGLAQDKSDFAVINYDWNQGRWKYTKPDRSNTMTVHTGHGQRDEIKQLDVGKARRTLGVWQAADGNETKQTKEMKEKASEWARAAARSSLTRSDIVVGIKTSLYPSITYGLMATTLTEDQCKDVFKPIREGALPKAGYSRKIPATVLHGPTKYGGIGIPDLYTVQGTEHVKALLDYGGQDNPTGDLMDINISGHLLEIGRSGHLFAMKYSEVQHLMTNTWMKETLKFTSKHDLRLETGGHTLQTWRSGDVLLMESLARATTHISTAEAQAFNRCRLHLQVVTMSDVCTASGDNLLREAWECKRGWSSPSSLAYQWPFQPRPGQKDIQIWQRILQQVFRVGTRYLTTTGHMGRYYNKTRRQTKWLYNGLDDSLYEKIPTGWRRWRRQRRRNRTPRYEPTEDTLPASQRTWMMAVVVMDQYGGVYKGHAPIGGEEQYHDHISGNTQRHTSHRVPNQAPRGSLLHALGNLPTSMHWLIEAMIPPLDNGRELASLMIRHKAKCVSDGSLKEQYGTAAAVSIGTTEHNGYWACNRITGRSDDQSSFRSELCGILTNIVIMNQIARVHGIGDGTVELACDNESALWVSFGINQVNTGDSSFDIIKTIHHELRKSPITWKHRHVKGHQDDDECITLDEWAKGNIEADAKAEEYWNRKYSNGTRLRPQPLRMPGEGWRLEYQEYPVVCNVVNIIHEATHYERMMEYWERKGRISPATHNQVDWSAYKTALRSLPRSKQQWVQKHHCGFEGTNSMLFKCKKRQNNLCPMCAEVETHRHILQCQSPQSTETYEQQERNLGSWLHATTSPEAKRAILLHLRAYRDNEEADTLEHWEEDIQNASEAQIRLGQYAFAEGIITPLWRDIQNKYISGTGRKINPGRWTSELIRRMWMICREVWETRNDEVHRATETRKSIIIAQLDAEIMEAHKTGRSNRFLPRMETRFFRMNVSTLLKQTEYQKRTWLHHAKRHILRDRQRVANSRSVQIMREFFQPGRVCTATTQAPQRSNMRAPTGTRRGLPTRP